jgi:predicted ester cyclase
MSTEENKAIFRRFITEVFNRRNLAIADETFAPDYIEHAGDLPDAAGGAEGFKSYVEALFAAYPDFQLEIEDLIAEGDRVVARLEQRGTQQGDFMGMPATGKLDTWTEIHICRMVNGKQVEHWGGRIS